MCSTTFRNVFGKLNSFLPLFFYFVILFVHISKMADNAILEKIDFKFFVRERCLLSIVSVNFVEKVISNIPINLEVLFTHKFRMAATVFLENILFIFF